MTTTLRVSVFCPDRVGLVSAITGKLFDLGGNLGDTAFAVLGTGAEFTTVCDIPADVGLDEIEDQLKALSELQEADIRVSVFEMPATHGPTANVTHNIEITGEDHPGLVARITEVFIEFNANIVRLNSEKISGTSSDQYRINISVWIPESLTGACLATIDNIAATLQMHCQSEKV